MKKIIAIILTGALMFSSLTACSKSEQEPDGAAHSSNISAEQDETQQVASDKLTLLCDDSSSFSNHFGTEDGYYYFTECEEIADGLFGMHLMYIDYATKKEVYLCSDSSCRHDSEQCNSVYLQSEFGSDSLPFVWGDYLYVLNRGYDSDGSVSIDMGNDTSSPEAETVTLYRMNLDGSSRQKIYTFPADITTEKLVFGEGNNLWFVTKKLETESETSGSYTTSTDRELSKYSIADNKLVDSIPLNFGDDIYQTVVGASDGYFVLSGVAYPDGMSESEVRQLSDEDWKRIYKDSTTIYATLDAAGKSKTEIYRMSNDGLRSTCAVKDGYLFASDCNSGGITKINLATGEQEKLAELDQNYIYFTMSDMLCCLGTGTTDDVTLYFVGQTDGEIHHSTLTNQSLGWQLDVLADAGDNVLVVYDYDATKEGDGYTINQYKYALISKDDLYKSNPNYMPITMEGRGK